MPNKSKYLKNNFIISDIKIRILKILNLNKNKNYFYLNDLDNNINLQNKIIKLGEECKLFFSISHWSYFRNKKNNKLHNRSYLSLLKNILKLCDITYINKQTSYKINDIVIYVTKYYVNF